MEKIINGFSVGTSELTIMFNIGMGLIAGVIIMMGYILGQKDKRFSKNFAITLLLLPPIMTVVIPFIATDLKKAVSLAGIFALVRFRSIPGDSKDILYVFFTLAVGVVMGLSNYIVAFTLTIVVTVLFILLQRKWTPAQPQVLRITIPEDMNYKDVFDDIFQKYLEKCTVKNVKTSNMGTLFVISYDIRPKKDMDAKAFIDELRTRNGNLNIIIENSDELQTPTL
ncbi:MAG: DUF4956 domain-containing protein [Treponema sp.]|nr:DUF4956 domain-containing protein [Treponema sp.]